MGHIVMSYDRKELERRREESTNDCKGEIDGSYCYELRPQGVGAVSILGFENSQSFFSYNCPCTYGVPQCAAHRNARTSLIGF